MKKNNPLIFFIFIFCLFICLSPRTILSADSVRVTRVIDGDTIILSDGQHVRYLGIDAPERAGKGPAEFLAQESTQFNRRLVLKKEVRLEFGQEKRDRYDRLLAYVFLDNGLFVNGELVKQGLAHVLYHGPRMERFDELLKLQREAIQDSRGIWAKALKESEDSYRGQVHTRRFHRLDCPFGKNIAPKNLILVQTKKEAYWQGFSPCRNCKP
ncbi:MAG: thermonuclease family protein [Thermodesulfobacteriota bacterium]